MLSGKSLLPSTEFITSTSSVVISEDESTFQYTAYSRFIATK